MGSVPASPDRRPIAARQSAYARGLTAWLVRHRVRPNAISLAGLLAALVAGLSLWATARAPWPRLWWALAALFIGLRLLANMLDGMVALAAGQASRTGLLYNEVPDRIADALIFIAAGFAAGSSPHAGYLAALAAVLVAYGRALGNSLGVQGLFLGPMAKSQRMFALAALAGYHALTPAAWQPDRLLAWGLVFIFVASLGTFGRRLWRIAQEVRA